MVSKNPLEKRFFKYCDDPRHWNSPFTIIVKRVQRASHSSMLFDESKMVFPELRAFDTTFHRFRLVDASIPTVGSSEFKAIQLKIKIKIRNILIRYLRKPALDHQ